MIDTRNRIAQGGHKDTYLGHKILAIATRDCEIQALLETLRPKWSTEGWEWSTPLWHQHIVRDMLIGKYSKKINNPDWLDGAEIKPHNNMEPLWFNTARNLMEAYIRKEKHEKSQDTHQNYTEES